MMVGYIGWTAAPAGPAAIADPAAEAQAEFVAAASHSPLGPDAVTAALMADPATVTSTTDRTGAEPAPARGLRLTSAEAVATLQRAAAAAGTTTYVGEQTYLAHRTDRTLMARVRVVAESGAGSQISVLGINGVPVLNGFTPAATPSRMADPEVWALLARNYGLTGWRGAEVAGRPATLVVATRAGLVATRWWVDDRSGVVLWQDTFGPDGRPVASAGFTTIRMQRWSGTLTSSPAKLARPATTTTLTVSNAGRLVQDGWFGQPQLGELSLVRLRTDRAPDPGAVHLTYSDGINVVTVFQRRGCLSDPPAEAAWDPTAQAYVRPGANSFATWQSGGTVFTVMTNGSSRLLADAVAGLPHEPVWERTTMERIQAGWAEILADLRG